VLQLLVKLQNFDVPSASADHCKQEQPRPGSALYKTTLPSQLILSEHAHFLQRWMDGSKMLCPYPSR
jgi:hypothetical protein